MINEKKNGIIISVKVVPNAKKNRLVVNDDGSIKAWIAKEPVKGKVNQELILFFAKKFDLTPSCIVIVSGKTSPNKKLLIEGMTKENWLKKL